MAYRKTIIATNEIYHIYNRGVDKKPIFLKHKNYTRFMELMNYYRFVTCPLKFSYFKELAIEERNRISMNLVNESEKLVEIYAFCLMPNHFHLLVNQLVNFGISKFIAKVTNSYSHYFNILNDRTGHLFQGNFSAVRIEDDEQFIHVNRYIHLNPVTSYITEFKNLENYRYSSYRNYINKIDEFCNTKETLVHFKNIQNYKKFIENQVDYARKLKNIEHLLLE